MISCIRLVCTRMATKVTEKPEILFARLDLEEVLKKVEELHPKQKEEEKANRGSSSRN